MAVRLIQDSPYTVPLYVVVLGVEDTGGYSETACCCFERWGERQRS